LLVALGRDEDAVVFGVERSCTVVRSLASLIRVLIVRPSLFLSLNVPPSYRTLIRYFFVSHGVSRVVEEVLGVFGDW
jgi:hypothetical protein